jgi:LPS export ABC transporter protein LptC
MNIPEPRSIVYLLLLLAGAVVSGYIVSGTWQEEDKPRRPELSLAYYLDDAELSGSGPNGELLFQIWTDHAAQEQGDETITMESVRMVYGPPTALAWKLEAQQGKIPTDTSVIELSGDVVAVSATEDGSPTIIRTQRLDIVPSTREASTTDKVEIEFNGRILYATGMRANLESNDLKLLSNVNGKFLP